MPAGTCPAATCSPWAPARRGRLPGSSRCSRKLTYKDAASSAVLVLETAEPPPAAVVKKVATATGAGGRSAHLPLCADPEPRQRQCRSSRACWRWRCTKANDLGYSAGEYRRRHRCGAHPCPAFRISSPPWAAPTTRSSMAGWCSSSSGVRQGDAGALAEKLPSVASRDFGEPFARIFERFKGDFYAIDPLLFSPAEVIVTRDRNRPHLPRRRARRDDARTEPWLAA